MIWNWKTRKLKERKLRYLHAKHPLLRKENHTKWKVKALTEIGVIDNLVFDNVIMNKNVIIQSGKEVASEDEASSSQIRFSPRVDDQTCEPLHTDPMDEAITCWDMGKAILQIHDGSQLMT